MTGWVGPLLGVQEDSDVKTQACSKSSSTEAVDMNDGAENRSSRDPKGGAEVREGPSHRVAGEAPGTDL